MELGLCAGRSGKRKSVVVCPDGYWKKGNVQVVCQRLEIVLVDDVEELTMVVLERLGIRTEGRQADGP